MGLFNIISGLILLVFGLRLFWLFIAIAGFLVGMEFSGLILPGQPQWVLLLVAVGAGCLGALLAVLAQRVAFALVGFYGGSYLALIVAQSFGAEGSILALFAVGGVVGAVFATLIMDWAIIMLSSLVGAGAIVEGLGLGQTISIIIFFALAVTGVSAQARLLTQSKET